MTKSHLKFAAAIALIAAPTLPLLTTEIRDTYTVTPAPAPAPEFPTYSLPPCESEDSDNCYWDAARMGNGTGQSFISLEGVLYYAR